jgi:diketogulonate reductase-like aldo/keto reductase
MSTSIRAVALRDKREVPALGLGTWRMGDDTRRRAEELRVIQRSIDLGMSLIDTAEIYGDGKSERLVGEAIAGRRDEVFLVTKVAPSHATRDGTIRACEASLKRLGTEAVDLYLLHWIGGTPVEETIAGFEKLRADGKIRGWGVSNFDTSDIARLPKNAVCLADQVLYNPQSRGVEFSLLPECAKRGIAIMAYTPLGQNGRVLRSPVLAAVAQRHGATVAQVALAWAMRHPDVIVIPKTSTLARLEENRGAADLTLTEADLAEIDRAFSPPRSKRALEML